MTTARIWANAFEYLLSIMGSQGDAGQFRTPRHIIDMMVEIVDPKKKRDYSGPCLRYSRFSDQCLSPYSGTE